MEGEREEGKVGASGGVGAREGGSNGDGTARPTKDKPKNCLNSYIHEKCDSTYKSGQNNRESQNLSIGKCPVVVWTSDTSLSLSEESSSKH